MSDTAEPRDSSRGSRLANDTAEPARAPSRSSGGASPPATASRAGSGGESSGTLRLVCAVSAAAALGVACGLWLNARLWSSLAETRPPAYRLLPEPEVGGKQPANLPAAREELAPSQTAASPEGVPAEESEAGPRGVQVERRLARPAPAGRRPRASAATRRGAPSAERGNRGTL